MKNRTDGNLIELPCKRCGVSRWYPMDDMPRRCPHCEQERKDAALGAFVRELLDVAVPDSPQRETDRIRNFIAAQEQP